MCAKNNTHWREQAVMEWSRRVASVVACCHSVKLCALAARAFRSQQRLDLRESVAGAQPGGGAFSLAENFKTLHSNFDICRNFQRKIMKFSILIIFKKRYI